MNVDGLLEKRAQEAETVVEKTEQEQEQGYKDGKSPYETLVEEFSQGLSMLKYHDSVSATSEKWAKLCTFALENVQGLYGLWLSTCMAGEKLSDKIIIGLEFLPPIMKQKDLIDEAAKRQAEAQAAAQAQFQAHQQQQAGGIAVPQGYVRPPTKRGRRGRKQ